MTQSDAARDDATVVAFSVPEMDCPSCAGKVENSVQALDGIRTLTPRSRPGN